jgi:hypothetical protein
VSTKWKALKCSFSLVAELLVHKKIDYRNFAI